jgi:uncharacterized protein
MTELVTDGVPGTPLLMGVVGSRAYGLATQDSDVDMLGMYAAPTEELVGLHPPTARKATTHRAGDTVDVTWHEAGKLASLALGGNPSVMELLWLERYQLSSPLGRDLVALRRRLLSQQRVKDAYLGFASQQFQRLSNEGKFPDVPASRIAKHARHLLRLVEQGTHLWVTGHLVLRVADPKYVVEFGERVAGGDVAAASRVLSRARRTFDTVKSVLPVAPDEALVEAWLQRVRYAHYTPPKGVVPHPAAV